MYSVYTILHTLFMSHQARKQTKHGGSHVLAEPDVIQRNDAHAKQLRYLVQSTVTHNTHAPTFKCHQKLS